PRAHLAQARPARRGPPGVGGGGGGARAPQPRGLDAEGFPRGARAPGHSGHGAMTRPRSATGARPVVGRLIARLRREQPGWRTTSLAEVAAQRRDPFHVLIACLLSLRTKDETTGPAAARLF